MKSLTTGAALGLALAVSGCGDTSAPNTHAPGIKIANPGSDRLKTLSPLNQRIGLMRAVLADRKQCRRVLGLAYQQQHGDLAMWVVLCAQGGNWAVFIAPNEVVQVRDCRETVELGLPACRPVPPLPADPTSPPGTEVSANELEAANANLTGNAQ
ncbi:MAG TPA: hypothetical protein VES64_07790 [Allosphingosinicella sp.]|nr:hypothetical protein [Allosphingosinicella sp.]